MVKHVRKNTSKSIAKQGKKQVSGNPTKIKPNTQYELCNSTYHSPSRKTVSGSYTIVYGFLMLLFADFACIGQFKRINSYFSYFKIP